MGPWISCFFGIEKISQAGFQSEMSLESALVKLGFPEAKNGWKHHRGGHERLHPGLGVGSSKIYRLVFSIFIFVSHKMPTGWLAVGNYFFHWKDSEKLQEGGVFWIMTNLTHTQKKGGFEDWDPPLKKEHLIKRSTKITKQKTHHF